MFRSVLATALLAASLQAGATDVNIDGSYLSFWQPTEQRIGYLLAGFGNSGVRTFKNRPDGADEISTDPMNIASQALRIDAQPDTGFERGIIFGPSALSPSPTRTTPIAIDLSEMTLAIVERLDLIRVPDGCAVVYLGHGQLGTRCDAVAP